MLRALITGSGGLVGSECTRLLCESGWEVTGVDNDMRREFFGREGSTLHEVSRLQSMFPGYEHCAMDIRDRSGVRDLIASRKPSFIIHTAGQPSHDRAAAIPYDDFDVNAVGTLNLLVAARDYCSGSPFCFTSTNKVYGDRPNELPLIELEKRFEYADAREGIDETMSIDQCTHSLFGASKLAADVLCQEFGRYFGMPIGVFRAGCLTGPLHAAVALHGYLAFIVSCAVSKRPYTILGYKGKQVRDQLHCRDLARLFLAFFENPRSGEVYNVGGGRKNNISILETLDALDSMGFPLNYSLSAENRIGDHVAYITDLSKVREHFSGWRQEYDMNAILSEILDRKLQELRTQKPEFLVNDKIPAIQ
ncbi:MAG: NAD-dependent epimerase/dehydratase family protein [Acidobacteriales bacterium]|nr:NAD-dependent epimerase/dehydratase family protein [Terriglobales bacterium]